jgi:hypothetical protein
VRGLMRVGWLVGGRERWAGGLPCRGGGSSSQALPQGRQVLYVSSLPASLACLPASSPASLACLSAFLASCRLSCPAGPISVSESLPYNRMLGLECIAPGVASLQLAALQAWAQLIAVQHPSVLPSCTVQQCQCVCCATGTKPCPAPLFFTRSSSSACLYLILCRWQRAACVRHAADPPCASF